MGTFDRAVDQAAISGVATALGASVVTPIEDHWFGFPKGARLTQATVDDQVFFVPFALTRACTVKTIGTESTAGGAGSTLRFAIYTASALGVPETLLDESATVASTGTGAITVAIGTVLRPGVYFAAVKADGATPPTVTSVAASTAVVAHGDAAADVIGADTAAQGFYVQAAVATAFPASATPAAALVAEAPIVIIETDAVEA